MCLWRVQTPAFPLWQMKEIATASGRVSQSHQSYKEAYTLDSRNLKFSIKLEWTFSKQLRGIWFVCCMSSVSKTSKWTLKSYAKRHCIDCQLQNQVAGGQEKPLFITSGKTGITHCVSTHVTQKGHNKSGEVSWNYDASKIYGHESHWHLEYGSKTGAVLLPL